MDRSNIKGCIGDSTSGGKEKKCRSLFGYAILYHPSRGRRGTWRSLDRNTWYKKTMLPNVAILCILMKASTTSQVEKTKTTTTHNTQHTTHIIRRKKRLTISRAHHQNHQDLETPLHHHRIPKDRYGIPIRSQFVDHLSLVLIHLVPRHLNAK